MGKTLTVVIGLPLSLAVTRDAPAVPVDLDSWAPGSLIRSHTDLFGVARLPVTVGQISSDVFFDGVAQYTYVHTVTPHFTVPFEGLFATAFPVAGFSGIGG